MLITSGGSWSNGEPSTSRALDSAYVQTWLMDHYGLECTPSKVQRVTVFSELSSPASKVLCELGKENYTSTPNSAVQTSQFSSRVSVPEVDQQADELRSKGSELRPTSSKVLGSGQSAIENIVSTRKASPSIDCNESSVQPLNRRKFDGGEENYTSNPSSAVQTTQFSPRVTFREVDQQADVHRSTSIELRPTSSEVLESGPHPIEDIVSTNKTSRSMNCNESSVQPISGRKLNDGSFAKLVSGNGSCELFIETEVSVKTVKRRQLDDEEHQEPPVHDDSSAVMPLVILDEGIPAAMGACTGLPPVPVYVGSSSKKKKSARQKGQSYVTKKGVLVPEKKFDFVRCKCRHDCANISYEERKKIFETFWLMGNWDAQSCFIRANTQEVKVKKHSRIPDERLRHKMLHFNFNRKRVCKKVFCATLGISPSRINYLITKKTIAGTSMCSPDKRGRKVPGNKLKQEIRLKIRNFLRKFPKYSSHYSLTNKLYFHPALTKRKLLSLYNDCNPGNCVSMFTFKTFLKENNVSIYVPKKDTCAKCDKHEAVRKSSKDTEVLRNIEKESEEHKSRALSARLALKASEDLCRQDSTCLCFTFDLQKTQPMPYINTSVAFYKRQMWLYNLGINDRKDNHGTMCLWTEIEAKRGSNEVASCLLQFLEKKDLSKYRTIHSYSDGCGGQNRNKTMVALFIYVCHTTPIESWTHVFMESGHSFLPNDTDFGKIEKKKNRLPNIYDFENWVDVIKKCNFEVLHMHGKFKNVSSLLSHFSFRNVDTKRQKFSWLNLKWIRVKEGSSIVEYKTSCSPEEDIKTINFGKPSSATNIEDDLPSLYMDLLPISREKFEDIMSLMEFIPSAHQEFFLKLPHLTPEGDVAEPYPDELEDA